MAKSTENDKQLREAYKKIKAAFPGTNLEQIYVDPVLERGGKLLYGNQWKKALAKDLEVSPKTIGEWHSGKKPYPVPWVEQQIEKAFQKRIAEMTKFASALEDLRILKTQIEQGREF